MSPTEHVRGLTVLQHDHDLYIPIAGGGWIATDGDMYEVGGQVFVYDAHGNELGTWTADEFGDDPELVVGAFLRLIAATTPYAKDRFRKPNPAEPIPETGEFNPRR